MGFRQIRAPGAGSAAPLPPGAQAGEFKTAAPCRGLADTDNITTLPTAYKLTS